MWFVLDTNGSFYTCESEEEAMNEVNQLLKDEKEYALLNGEWYGDVTNICYGKIHGEVRLVKEWEEDGKLYQDYELVKV